LFEQFSIDRIGFKPEFAAIVPVPPRYVIGPYDIIGYAAINVDYRSEPELSEIVIVRSVCRTPPHKGRRR
jgi:hypothetical protein